MDTHKCGKHEEKEHHEEQVTIPAAEYNKLKEDAAKGAEAWDKMLRMQADLENTRKRIERDKQEFLKFANEKVLAQLLNTLDDLERVVALAESKHQDMPAFLKGVEMILAHLYEMLKDHGVTPIEAEGKPFDPNFHEALMQAEDPSVPEHTVLEEMQKGYMLYERVLRTSKVKVSKTGKSEQ